MTMGIDISDRSYAWLVEQRGEFYHLKDDRPLWLSEYVTEISKTFGQIVRAQPEAKYVLDLGSGIGGIDMLLIRRKGVHATLIDGDTTDVIPTRAHLHRDPYNSKSATIEFLEANGCGCHSFSYKTPDLLGGATTYFDTIVSLRSWCFHYPPETYLDAVKSLCFLKAKLILDVRLDKPEWRETLRRSFKELHILECTRKFERVLYEAR